MNAMNRIEAAAPPVSPPLSPPAAAGGCPVAALVPELLKLHAALRDIAEEEVASAADASRCSRDQVAVDARREALEHLALHSQATSAPGALLQLALIGDAVTAILALMPAGDTAGGLRARQLAASIEAGVHSAIAAVELLAGVDRDAVGGGFYFDADRSPFRTLDRRLGADRGLV